MSAFNIGTVGAPTMTGYQASPFEAASPVPYAQVNSTDQVQTWGAAQPQGQSPTEAQLATLPDPVAPYNLSPMAQQIVADQSLKDGVDWMEVLKGIGGSGVLDSLMGGETERAPAGQVRQPPQLHNSPFTWAMPGVMTPAGYQMNLRG